MKTITFIAVIVGVIVVAMYAYPIVVLHKKIEFHPKRVLQDFLGYWKNYSPGDDSSHACLKLMMKMKVVSFHVEKGRVVKMTVITDSNEQGRHQFLH